MNELKIFENPDFGQVRTLQRDGEPWFVAADVCRALEIANNRDAMSRLDSDEKGVASTDTPGGKQQVAIINEPGLYALVMGSRKPEARAFKRWITHEVIPSIRKSGGYIAGQESMSDTELMAKALMVAQRQLEARNQEIRTMQPKAMFADAVSASSSSILIGDLAKLLKQNGADYGQNRLFQWMRDNGWLIKQRGASWNMPTQRGMEMGLFNIKETVITHSDGHISVNRTVKVTGAGQVFFINKILGHKDGQGSGRMASEGGKA